MGNNLWKWKRPVVNGLRAVHPQPHNIALNGTETVHLRDSGGVKCPQDIEQLRTIYAGIFNISNTKHLMAPFRPGHAHFSSTYGQYIEKGG